MRVTHLSAEGLFSFGEDFGLDLDNNLTVVVGPNASGKSNLGAIVDLVLAAVGWASELDPDHRAGVRPTRWDGVLANAAEQGRHRGWGHEQEVQARLGVELTTEAERELIAAFMRAVIATAPRASSTARDLVLEAWASPLPTEEFAPLFRGELVVSHSGVGGSTWQVRFEPADQVGDARLALNLSNNVAILTRAGEPLGHLGGAEIISLLGFDSSSQQAEQGTASTPAPGEVLARLVPEAGSSIPLCVRIGPVPDDLPEPARAFLRLASLGGGLGSNTTWGPGVVWERILRKGVRHLRAPGAGLAAFDGAGLPLSQWSYGPDALAEPAGAEAADLPRRLWEMQNANPGSPRLKSVQAELAELAPGWELAITGGLEAAARPASPVPLHLAVEPGAGAMPGLTNAQRVYASPAGAAFEEHHDVTLQVHLWARRDGGDWEPLSGAGTGVAQALMLAEALGDAAGRFVLLDEPAVNLHPSWQRHVRARLEALSAEGARGGAGQFLLVTHSAPLAAPIRASSALPLRMTHDGRASSAIAPPPGDLRSDWPKDLHLSPEGWGLLFAEGVVLVEGDTELGALPLWFDKISERDGRPWSARNISLFNAGSDTGFESWGRYLAHYRVPWAVVCDGMILDPYLAVPKNWVLLQVARARKDDTLQAKAEALRQRPKRKGARPDRPTFDDVCALAEDNGILTLANWFAKRDNPPAPPTGISAVESIDDLIDRNPALKAAKDDAKTEFGDLRSKVRLGVYVAAACESPQEVRDLYKRLIAWGKGAAGGRANGANDEKSLAAGLSVREEPGD